MHASEIDGTPADYYQHTSLVVDEGNADLFRGGFLGQGAFYVRPFKLKSGECKQGHAHYIDHLWLLLSGQARVNWKAPDGSEGSVLLAGGWAALHIKADYWHEIVAVTDAEFCCMFSKHEADRVYGDAATVEWTLEKDHG